MESSYEQILFLAKAYVELRSHETLESADAQVAILNTIIRILRVE